MGLNFYHYHDFQVKARGAIELNASTIYMNGTQFLSLGAVHKLRLQEEGGRWSKKNRIFVNIYIIENLNGGG